MDWEFTPFAAPLFVGGVAVFALAVAAIRRRGAPGAIPIAALAAGIAVYAVAYGFEIGSLTVSQVQFWLKVEYFGVTTVPGLVLLVVLDYLGYRRYINIIMLTGLFTIPAITCVLAWTNESHMLIWNHITIDRSLGFTLTSFERGAWYLVHNGFIFLELIAGLVIMFRSYFRATGVYRRQQRVLLAAVILPIVIDIIYWTRLVFPGLDLNPYGQIVAVGLLGWGMLNYRILDLVPVARDAVLKSMADAVLVFDGHNRLVDFNPAAHEILAEPVSSIGKKFGEIFPDWPQDLTSSQVRRVMQKEIPLTASGSERIFDVSITPIASQPLKTEGRVAVLRDVTRHVLAQSALEKANQRLDVLQTAGNELSRTYILNDLVRVTVQAAVALSGAKAAAVTRVGPEGCRVLYTAGGYSHDLVGKLLPSDRGIISRVIRSNKPDLTLNIVDDPDYVAMITTTRAQMTLPLRSGDKLHGVLLLETNNPADFSSAVFEAIELLASRAAVAMENALVSESRDRLVKDLDSFAHTVAHDLKNPLNIMLGYAEMLKSMEMADDAKKIAERIIYAALQATDIVDALLSLAQASNIEDGRPEPMEMASAVGGVITRLHLMIEQAGAEITTPTDWPNVLAYRPWVEEAWANYISNAIKYGGKPPRIELGWEVQSDRHFRFWVQDNGAGLSSDQIEKLFQPFVRLDNSTTDGYGLGLSIVQRITERLGGHVGVDSVIGQGSKFYFTLPPVQPQKVQL